MVIFIEWPLSPVNPKSTCGLPMSGEDTGLEAIASPMVGYLGKVSTAQAFLSCCHLRKAELYLKTTVNEQYQSKTNIKTEIFGKRRSVWA